MKVLVACEFSGVVRDAFRRWGHEAVSCDFLGSEAPGHHVLGDVRAMALEEFDLLIAHPPCTLLASSGARWWTGREREQDAAIEFFRYLLDAPVARVAVENPIGIISTRLRKPDQIIQPWMFGHPETKATCLWLRGLPLLRPTLVVDGREARVHRECPGPERWKRRSRTLPGVADAMAVQWGRAGLP
jgi:hypothetical protein